MSITSSTLILVQSLARTTQIFNAFNSRSDRVSAFHRPFDNRLLWAAAGVTVLLQVAVVYLGPLNRAFATTPLDSGQWLTCWLLASTVLLANEVRKLFVRRRRRARASVVDRLPSV